MDAQTIRQLVRTCNRNAATAGMTSVAEASAVADSGARQHMPAALNGSGVTATAQADGDAVQTGLPGGAAAQDTGHGSVGTVAADVSHLSELPEPQEAVEAGTRPGSTPSNAAAQPGDARQKAHSAAHQQLLRVLRPLAQRALLDARRAVTGQEHCEEDVHVLL